MRLRLQEALTDAEAQPALNVILCSTLVSSVARIIRCRSQTVSLMLALHANG
jgi:hypothetical protein